MPPGLRCAALLFLLVAAAPAQTSLTGGALDGLVTDSDGGRIPGASLTVRDLANGHARQVSTNAEGAFRLAELPVGTYEVSLSQPGFAAYRHTGIALALGSTVHLDIVLQTGSVSTQLTVTAQPPPIDPERTAVTSAVDRERIEELPVQSRNYLNFVLLAPGVANSAQQPAQRSLAPLPDSGFSFGGLRGRSNNLAIDGLDNNDEFVGSSRTELSLETVQEFQVVNAGLSAESGGASGGSINVVTRTGANTLHGDAFLFVQNGALNARTPFEAESFAPHLHRYRIGASQGGPIVKDRTFYYAAFEQEHSRSLEDSFIDPAVAAAVNRVLATGVFRHLPVAQIGDGLFPASRAETELSAKLNHQLSERNSLMLRYAFTNNREAGDAFNTSGLADASARGSSFLRDHSVAAALTTAFGPHAVGDFRFQFAGRRAVLRTNDTAGPGIEIAGLAQFGRPYDGNGRRTESHGQAAYTYSHSFGRHLWKAGATIHHVGEEAAMLDGFGGLYLFGSLADFAAWRPTQWRQAFGAPATNYGVTNYGVFLQDHWSATARLTVDLGLRYDFEHLPAGFHQDRNNVSPRVGLAFLAAPGWVIRSGYGIFFDRYVLASLNPALQKNAANAFEQVVDGAPAGVVKPSIHRADPGLATSYSQQASFGVERLLSRDLTATLSYLFVRGVKLSRTRNINVLGLDPRWNGIYQLEDSANSRYQGVSLALNRRLSEELEFSAAYTFSKACDDASDFNEQPANPLDLRSEWALSRQDQRHRLVLNALWELPIGDDEDTAQPQDHGWLARVLGHVEIAPIFTVESGRPVNPLTGFDNGTGAYPLSERPPGFGRNSFKSPLLANTDLRLVKYFPFAKTARLDLVAEAFNLFNRANVAQVNPVFGPGFLQPITGAGARQIQFSLDFEY